MANITKWDLLDEGERAELDATPCDLPCFGCDKLLVTEGDFARHFILYNVQLRNVGYCPVKGPGKNRF